MMAMTDRDTIRNMFEPNMTPELRQMVFEPMFEDTESPFDQWYYRCASFREMFALKDFKQKFYIDRSVSNFVYFRRAGVVFSTLIPCDHCQFMGGLSVLSRMANHQKPTSDVYDYSLRGRLDRWFSTIGDESDYYLHDALGGYQSSCNAYFYRHKNLNLTPAEQDAFGDMQHEVSTWSL